MIQTLINRKWVAVLTSDKYTWEKKGGNVQKNTKSLSHKKVIKEYIAQKFKRKVLKKCVSQLVNKNVIFLEKKKERACEDRLLY